MLYLPEKLGTTTPNLLGELPRPWNLSILPYLHLASLLIDCYKSIFPLVELKVKMLAGRPFMHIFSGNKKKFVNIDRACVVRCRLDGLFDNLKTNQSLTTTIAFLLIQILIESFSPNFMRKDKYADARCLEIKCDSWPNLSKLLGAELCQANEVRCLNKHLKVL